MKKNLLALGLILVVAQALPARAGLYYDNLATASSDTLRVNGRIAVGDPAAAPAASVILLDGAAAAASPLQVTAFQRLAAILKTTIPYNPVVGLINVSTNGTSSVGFQRSTSAAVSYSDGGYVGFSNGVANFPNTVVLASTPSYPIVLAPNDVEMLRLTPAGGVTVVSSVTVNATVQMTGFKMVTGAGSGLVLQSDASGNGTWVSILASSQTWSGQNNFSAAIQVNSTATFSGAGYSIVASSGVSVGGTLDIGLVYRTSTCNSSVQCTTTCSSGEWMTGGGCLIVGSTLIQTLPFSSRAWTCATAGSTNITTYALCARVVNGGIQ